MRHREFLRVSIEDLQKQITVARESATADASRREKDLARVTSNLEIIGKRLGEVESLLDELAVTAPPLAGVTR